jgi:hypothetical protein
MHGKSTVAKFTIIALLAAMVALAVVFGDGVPVAPLSNLDVTAAGKKTVGIRLRSTHANQLRAETGGETYTTLSNQAACLQQPNTFGRYRNNRRRFANAH